MPRQARAGATTVINDRVTQAYTVLDALRRPGEKQAELAALKARRQLGEMEGRDPELLAALDRQIAVLEGRLSATALGAEDVQYLLADASTDCAVFDEPQRPN